MGQKVDQNKLKHLGERFFKYKQDMNTMKQTLERHFSAIINDIEEDFPSVQVEDCKEEEEYDDFAFINTTNWTCFICRSKNTNDSPFCTECGSPSPIKIEKKWGKK